MARRGVLASITAGVTALLTGCGSFGVVRYRFKTTVEVDTPQGVIRGSTVSQVEVVSGTDLMTRGTVRNSVIEGEAVAVDLPNGRTLFALLKTINSAGHDDIAFMSMRALDPAFDNDRAASARKIRSQQGSRSMAAVSPSDYPLLVMFGDTRDPKSVVLVDADNLAATVRGKARLRAITVEVVSEPISVGIRKRLRWLSTFPEPRLDNDFKPTTNPNLAQRLRHGDFVRGKSK